MDTVVSVKHVVKNGESRLQRGCKAEQGGVVRPRFISILLTVNLFAPTQMGHVVPTEIELELEVASPLHIGSGDVLGREDLIFGGETAFVPDIDAYFRDNPDQIETFVTAMERGEPVSDFITDPSRYARYTLRPWVSESSLGNSEVAVAMKDAQARPFIPGSTIKGFVRTALAARALSGGGQSLDSLDDWAVDDLFRLDQNDPMHDFLRCLTVRDSTPADTDALVLGEIKMYSLSDSGSMDAKFWSNYAEFIEPGTMFTTDLLVDTSLLEEMIESFGESWKVEAVFGSDRSEAGIVETISRALTSFTNDIAREDQTLTGDFDEVESFYDGLPDDRPRLRLGHGTGYHSNTVVTALPRDDRVSIRDDNRLGKRLTHDECGGGVTPDRKREDHLFCHECHTSMPAETADASPPLPKTRRFVRRQGRPAYPLGWVTASVRGSS